MQKNYPHAQAWYNNPAQQHPIADLDQYKLLKSKVSAVDAMIGNDKLELCCTPHRIYFPEDTLKLVYSLYKKKIDGQELTTE